MDFTKFDFTKFDATKMFDAEQVLKQVEGMTKQVTGYITDKKSRETLETVTAASIEYARANNEAVLAYAKAMQSALANLGIQTVKADA